MSEFNNPIHWLVALRGRGRGPEDVSFEEGQLVAQGYEFRVRNGVGAHYFNLPPKVFSIVTWPNGDLKKIDQGGLHELPSGRYLIQYVTAKELTGETELVSENTIDGASISISVFFKYCVLNPLQVFAVRDPLKGLVKSLEVDIREYIRANTHESLWEASRSKGDKSLSRFLRQQPNPATRNRALVLIDAEMQGFNPDPKFLELVRNIQIQGRQNKNDIEILAQKQNLERRVTEQDALIKKMRLNASAEQQEIYRQIDLKSIEVENKRRAWKRQYDTFAEIAHAVSEAASNGQSLNTEIMSVLADLAEALRENLDDNAPDMPVSPDPSPSPPGGAPRPASMGNQDKVEKLTNTLLTLLRPKG